MALLERQIVFKRKDGNGNTYMEFPVTKAECVDGAVLTVNNVAPDMNGNVAITSVTKATQDGSGNNIVNTYATKSELSEKASLSHSHAISEVTNLQTTLDAKAPLASPTFTGTPKAPTASAGTNTTQIATTAFVTTAIANKTSVASATKATQDASGNVITSTYATKSELNGKVSTASLEAAISSTKGYVDTVIADLIDSAPETLNTIGELATALQENKSVTEAINSAVVNKANSSEVVKLSGNQTIAGNKTFSSTISGSISGNAATATKATQDASGNVITTTYATKTELTNGLSGKSDTNHTHSEATTSAAGLMSSTDKSKLNGVESGANKYVHPSYTATSSGLYKVTVDSTGHVSATTAVTKSDITGLGIPAQDTVYTLPAATDSALGGVKVGSNITNTSGTISLTKDNVVNALGYTPSASTTATTLSTFGITATATELNYVDGVTSNVQTQLNSKLSTGGGNMTGSIAFGTDTGVGIKWGTRKNNGSVELNPFMGYCSNSGDGTFVVGSLLGTTHQTGLAIGGTSGNLLWKGAKILDGNNFSEFALSKSGTAAKATADANGNNIANTYATKTYVDTAVSGLVDSAPNTLNTLNELAAALGDDPNFATSIATQIGGKMNGSIHTVSERTRGSSEPTYGLS